MVSQQPLHDSQSHHFKGSHLSCACKPMAQCQPTVKLHRVFSSYRDSPGIFTWSAISPGLASRQYPHRDTIRAGRNFKCWFPPVVSRRPEPKLRRTTYRLLDTFVFYRRNEFLAPYIAAGIGLYHHPSDDNEKIKVKIEKYNSSLFILHFSFLWTRRV